MFPQHTKMTEDVFWLLTGVPSMVGGSSLPSVGRVFPGFILAANYTELQEMPRFGDVNVNSEISGQLWMTET